MRMMLVLTSLFGACREIAKLIWRPVSANSRILLLTNDKDQVMPDMYDWSKKEVEQLANWFGIKVTYEGLGKIGYVANSSNTVLGDSMSAGRIYDKVEDKFFVRVMFTTQSKVICKVEENSDGILEKEIQTQIEAAEEWLNK